MIRVDKLTERLIRVGNQERIARASGVPIVERFLFHHSDGGWLQGSEEQRMQVARRLLFLAWLIESGRCSDG